MTEAPAQMKRCKSLKSINFIGQSTNSNLMNINFEILQYQEIAFSYANYSVNLMLYVQPLKVIITIRTVKENNSIQ